MTIVLFFFSFYSLKMFYVVFVAGYRNVWLVVGGAQY